MNSRSKYRTKQREVLVGYLASKAGHHVTANDVCEYFKSKGTTIGQSTVYRQLESLVDEGVISKYNIDGSSPACFEYLGANSHIDASVCFHCKCEKCGKLIHLHCDELEEIQSHLFDQHHFKLNTMRTVFYGLCDQCCGLTE